MTTTQTVTTPPCSAIGAGGAKAPDTPIESQLSELTRQRVAFRANRLARVFKLDRATRDDIRQQLRLRAVLATRGYQHGRGASMEHFIRLHLDYEYRDLRRELSREPVTESLDRDECPARLPDHRPDCDLRMDLESFIERLPDDLAAIANGLKQLSAAQIAAEQGVHRGTVYRKLTTLRMALEGFFADDEEPRDTSGSVSERSLCGADARAFRPRRGDRVKNEPFPLPPSGCACVAEGGLA